MFREIISAAFNEGIPNYFISRKIDASVDVAQAKIDNFYDEYRKNIFILSVINSLFLVVSLISGLVISIKTIGIIIAFILLLVLTGRSLYIFVHYIHRGIIYRKQFYEFFVFFIKKHSFEMAVKYTLQNAWRKKYSEMTDGFTVKLHSILAKTGIVNHADEIENEFIEKHYRMIREHLVGNILRKTLAIIAVFWVYVFLLQPLVIYLTLGMRLTDILIYPVRMLGR
ncbi:MAG: hypothetical protein LBH44_01915 [Treponema sp.]|jgi:hypothetical protein|nr:hypothetical protein [Treponema sp.]